MNNFNDKVKKYMKETLLIEDKKEDLNTIKIILRNCFIGILTCIVIIIGLDLLEDAFAIKININRIFFQVFIFIYAIRGLYYCRKI